MAVRRRFGSGGKRRQTQWDAQNQWSAVTFLAAGEAFVLAFSEFNQVITVGPVSPPTPLTIIRTIVDYRVSSTGTAGEFFGAIGMCIVTQDALDQALLGIKSIPTPVADASSDAWLLHSFLHGKSSGTTAGETGFNTDATIESKAMRKIDDGYQVVLVGERDANLGSVGGGVFVLNTILRALVKVS